MIRYRYHRASILFVGINPHPGSFRRKVPFSNNKTFWYLLSDAGLLTESRDELRDDASLHRIYATRFNATYGLGFVNLIDRPTRGVAELGRGEETVGRRRLDRILSTQRPKVACFIGKIAFAKYIGSGEVRFGWQESIGRTKVFVMHFPLRGEAAVRVRELREVMKAARRTRRGREPKKPLAAGAGAGAKAGR